MQPRLDRETPTRMNEAVDSPVRPTAAAAGNSAAERATCDVFVLGGGPAGSTIAALLRGRGRDVVSVEKERHPRFHIGESLLPLNVMLFEKLGIKDHIERIGLYYFTSLMYLRRCVAAWLSRKRAIGEAQSETGSSVGV